MNMLARVQKLVCKLGTNNPEEILNTLGVKILELPMRGIRGIYKRLKRNTFVVVDCDLDEREKNFVLAHELGHHILHRGDNRVYLDRCTLYTSSRYEKEADLFAVCLMAPNPEDFIFEDSSIEAVACRIGISQKLAEKYLLEVQKTGWCPK